MLLGRVAALLFLFASALSAPCNDFLPLYGIPPVSTSVSTLSPTPRECGLENSCVAQSFSAELFSHAALFSFKVSSECFLSFQANPPRMPPVDVSLTLFDNCPSRFDANNNKAGTCIFVDSLPSASAENLMALLQPNTQYYLLVDAVPAGIIDLFISEASVTGCSLISDHVSSLVRRGTTFPDGNVTENGTDTTGTDPTDTGSTTETDSGTEETDSGTDGTTETTSDGTDLPSDGSTDTGTDTETSTDTGTDTGTDANSTETDTGTEISGTTGGEETDSGTIGVDPGEIPTSAADVPLLQFDSIKPDPSLVFNNDPGTGVAVKNKKLGVLDSNGNRIQDIDLSALSYSFSQPSEATSKRNFEFQFTTALTENVSATWQFQYFEEETQLTFADTTFTLNAYETKWTMYLDCLLSCGFISSADDFIEIELGITPNGVTSGWESFTQEHDTQERLTRLTFTRGDLQGILVILDDTISDGEIQYDSTSVSVSPEMDSVTLRVKAGDVVVIDPNLNMLLTGKGDEDGSDSDSDSDDETITIVVVIACVCVGLAILVILVVVIVGVLILGHRRRKLNRKLRRRTSSVSDELL